MIKLLAIAAGWIGILFTVLIYAVAILGLVKLFM